MPDGDTFPHSSSAVASPPSMPPCHAMSAEEIRRYVATGEPMDKAGAYGIQGKCAIFVDKIDGDYNNVVGLPVAAIYRELKKLGIDIYLW